MLMPLGKMAAPGDAATELIVTPLEADEEFEAKCPARPPTRAATSSSDKRVDQGARLERDCEDSGAGSGGADVAGALTGAGIVGSGDGAPLGSSGTFGSRGPVLTRTC